MKTNLLLIILIKVLIMSCNNKPKTNKKTENKKEVTQQMKPSKTESYTLQKITNYQNKDKPDYLIYESKVGGYLFTFHTKKTITYGVLEKYSDELDTSDYYLFPKQENLQDQITLNLKDALFLKKSTELNPTNPEDYPEYTYVDSLLKNNVILGYRGAGDSYYSIINVNKQTISNFGTLGSYELSADEKFLIGWHYSDANTSIDAICPEHKDMRANYTVAEEVLHNFATGEDTFTGKLGCEFVQ